MSLQPDYDLAEVANALGMSERWVRERIREGAEHQRYGRKIRFTPEQVDKLRATFTTSGGSGTAPITTGRRRKSA